MRVYVFNWMSSNSEILSLCSIVSSVKSFEYDGLAALNLTKWEYCLDLDNEL